ncbi:unnamed protein product [Psylliodes chrysocephalus]|uniref:Uncharacterized protein n=1 Tax=Psylliodes chrysocephalus TaxID=3402493 RepID=A0A9P0D4E7_9CUCU|nr:unnamed protein product [Psylliodes chrysocephala]
MMVFDRIFSEIKKRVDSATTLNMSNEELQKHEADLGRNYERDLKVEFCQELYVFKEQECQEISNQEVICHESVTTPLEEDAPCEVLLLRLFKNLINCQTILLDNVDIKIQKIRQNKWMMIISPQNTVAQRICGQDNDNVLLEGTFLLE